MRRFIRGGLVLTLSFACQAGAHGNNTKALCSGFVPKNDLNIPVNTEYKIRTYIADLHAVPMPGGLSKSQFDAICSRISKLYTPIVKKKGFKFSVKKNWTSGEVNAYADQVGKTWAIHMFGGLARHPAIGEEGFAIVACHEAGHHLGGAPKISADWASNEGASDYFATLKCMRFFYEGVDNETWLKSSNLDRIAIDSCEREHTARADQLFCMRAAAGAIQVGRLFADLDSVPAPRFETPDPKVVAQMDDSHPASQCRFDTYFAGGLCHVSKSDTQSDTDYKVGSCVQGVDARGWRPRCWFKP